ncbi:MAG: right-handed parallel beta-helix repeat-containing protein [Thermoplasmata archaeon]
MKVACETPMSLGMRKTRDHTGRFLKESTSYCKVLAVFVLALLVLSAVPFLTWQGRSASVIKINASTEKIKYTPRGPIHINGNANFTSANGVTGGSGTESDPYIIEGWEIDANGGTYAIWIENTSAYFVIRNCNVSNATSSGSTPYGAGIALNNVIHGTLDSNKCNNSRYGIYLYGSSQYNNITNNNASGNYDEGIHLASSSNNIITNNNASGNYFGIHLSCSSNNNIANNNASGNSEDGIYLYYSSNNNITYNWICNNANYGVRITEGSTGNTIQHNNFIGNGATALRYLSQGVSNDTPNGAGRGVNGNCQAYDDVGGNYWYDATTNEGNYWSNWDGNGWGSADAYPIDGGKASDWYPLGNPVSEFGSAPLFVLAFASLPLLFRRKKTPEVNTASSLPGKE